MFVYKTGGQSLWVSFVTSVWGKATKLTCSFKLFPLQSLTWNALSHLAPVSTIWLAAAGIIAKGLERHGVRVFVLLPAIYWLCVELELQAFCLSGFPSLWGKPPRVPKRVQMNGLLHPAERRNHLFYRFPALPSRITLLTLASYFLIGLAIDCPPSSLLASRWPITNKQSWKCGSN